MTEDAAAEIAVIVVNYGTADLAIEAVESVLARSHGGRTVEVHLLDNASPGDDAALFNRTFETQDWSGRVTLWLEQVNHGFGRGNNVVLKTLAARKTPPEFVFLLNPDARLENEAIDRLAAFLDHHPHVAAVGARITLPDGTPVSSAFRFPTLASEFSRAVNFGPVSRLFSDHQVALAPGIGTCEVDWVSGAAVMFRYSSMADVGFFYPAFFLYHEEVDLMHALSRAGHTIWHVSEAQVTHHEGAATQVRSGSTVRRRRPSYVYESWRIYFRKNHGRGYALATAACVAAGAAMNTAISVLRGKDSGLPKRFFRDQWQNVIWPLLANGPAMPNDQISG